MIFTQDQIDQLFEQARNAYPEECCGLISGTYDQVYDIHPAANVSAGDKTKTFEIDAKVRFDLIAQTGKRSVLGLYHSHPTGSPYPSETDKSMVYEPELIWVILTLEEIKAFRFIVAKQDFEEIPIQVNLKA